MCPTIFSCKHVLGNSDCCRIVVAGLPNTFVPKHSQVNVTYKHIVGKHKEPLLCESEYRPNVKCQYLVLLALCTEIGFYETPIQFKTCSRFDDRNTHNSNSDKQVGSAGLNLSTDIRQFRFPPFFTFLYLSDRNNSVQ